MGGVAVVILVIAGIWLYRRKKRASRQKQEDRPQIPELSPASDWTSKFETGRQASIGSMRLEFG